MSDRPFYESCGPNAQYVRNDLCRIYEREVNCIIGFELFMIREIIEECIPDSMRGFGSYRGYAVFGINKDLKMDIEMKIKRKKEMLAVRQIENWYLRCKLI